MTAYPVTYGNNVNSFLMPQLKTTQLPKKRLRNTATQFIIIRSILLTIFNCNKLIYHFTGFDPPGFPSCVCNFAGACQPGTATRTSAAAADPTNLVGIAPDGIDDMAYGTKNLGKVCEDGIVAALYDCNARTSLYSATRIDGVTASGKSIINYC